MTKKLIIGIIALVLLAGGGGAGYFFFLADNGDAAAEAEPAQIPGFVELETIATPIMQGDRIGRYIYVAVTLEVADQEDVKQVERAVP
jgi:flagellar FliL protein